MTILLVAVAFWSHAGHRASPCLRIEVDPLPRGVLGQTHYGGCVVHIAQRLTPARSRAAVRRLCTTVVHEVGHTLGLHHRASGIMAPSYGRAYVPRGCRRLRPPQSVP